MGLDLEKNRTIVLRNKLTTVRWTYDFELRQSYDHQFPVL